MLKERVEKQTFVLSDVQTVYYKILHSTDKRNEEQRYRELPTAQQVAKETEGQVVKMTKRSVETLEMEAVLT